MAKQIICPDLECTYPDNERTREKDPVFARTFFAARVLRQNFFRVPVSFESPAMGREL